MRVLVTGHRGFVGSYVYKALLKLGCYDVLGADWPDDIRHIQALNDVDAVVHLAAVGGVARAARNARFVMANNVEATMALRQALRTNEAGWLPIVVQVSSFSVYGDQPTPWDESTPPAPKEIYAASKLAQELCWTGYDGPVAVLRLSSVYGPGMRLDDPEATVIAKIARAARDGDVFPIYEDGQQERDFVHVNDVAACVAAILKRDRRDINRLRLTNVCSGEKVTIQKACELLGAKYEIRNRPRSEGDMRSCWGLTDRMRELIGRAPMSLSEHCRKVE